MTENSGMGQHWNSVHSFANRGLCFARFAIEIAEIVLELSYGRQRQNLLDADSLLDRFYNCSFRNIDFAVDYIDPRWPNLASLVEPPGNFVENSPEKMVAGGQLGPFAELGWALERFHFRMNHKVRSSGGFRLPSAPH